MEAVAVNADVAAAPSLISGVADYVRQASMVSDAESNGSYWRRRMRRRTAVT